MSKFFISSVVSGCFIHLGFLFSMKVGSMFEQQRLLAIGIVFSLGIILVQLAKTNLFTSYTYNFTRTILDNDFTFNDTEKLVLCFFGNLVGVLIMPSNIFLPEVKAMIDFKDSLSLYELFIRGVLCNMIICLLVYINSKIKEVSGKIIVSIMLISCFIILGFEHSIANMCFYLYGILNNYTCLFMAVRNISVVALGNLLGGMVVTAIFKGVEEK